MQNIKSTSPLLLKKNNSILLHHQMAKNNLKKDSFIHSKLSKIMLESVQKCFMTKIFEICSLLEHSLKTFYDSYRIFLKVSESLVIKSENISILSYICLMISTKINECRPKMLSLSNVCKIAKNYDISVLSNLEFKVCNILGFKLKFDCEYSYLITLLEFDNTVITNGKSFNNKFISKMKFKFKQQSEYLLNLFVFSKFFGKFNPKFIGVSIIVALRMYYNYEDPYFTNFEKITGLNKNDIAESISILSYLFNDDINNKNENSINEDVDTDS